MSKEVELKMLPLTINNLCEQHTEVIEKYGLNPLVEYLAYLIANTSIHHYGEFITMECWYVNAIKEWSKQFGNVWE